MSELIGAWRDRVRAAAAGKEPLRIVGGGSKDFYGQSLEGDVFDTRGYSGIVDYDPTELVITARSGTRLSDIEAALAERNQMLSFEPPYFGDDATLGGCIAAGLSGPRRPHGGALRDHMLGVRLIDGRGDDLSFGGRVMKNVAGFDVSRLIAGSLGTLGLILEASLKCMPRPRAEATLVFEVSADEAIRKVNEWSAMPLPLSASCWCDDRLNIRLSGAASAIASARSRLGGEEVDEDQFPWRSIREQKHVFFRDTRPMDRIAATGPALWRLSVRSTAPYEDLGSDQLIEWGGALRWIHGASDQSAPRLRAWAEQHGGHATLFRAEDKSPGAFHTLTPALLGLHRRLKLALDPAGIFNPHRMYPEF
jgi:glycolate oxidase FAD binding subunit